MADPSDYELSAWRAIQQFKGRPLSRATGNASGKAAAGAAEIGKRATKYIENYPRTRSAVSHGQGAAAKGTHAVGSGARRVAGTLPDGVTGWSGAAVESMRRTVGRVSRAGLSSRRVVARHQKCGHDVASLADLRRLDLEQIDAVRGRGASWYYPAIAALSGAGAGLVISGGELVVTVSAGAAAAPSGGVIAGAVLGDAAAVLGLASRSVGHVSLLYGYDPEEPAEKLFVMSVVNAGTAMSASAKTAALADISRITQALVRGKAWAVLDKSVVTAVSRQFAKAFSIRFTKQSLGKVVPAAGILLAAPSTGPPWEPSSTPPTSPTGGGSSSRSTRTSPTAKYPDRSQTPTRTARTTPTRRSACSTISPRQADPTSTEPRAVHPDQALLLKTSRFRRHPRDV